MFLQCKFYQRKHNMIHFCDRLGHIEDTMTEIADTDQAMAHFLGLNTGKRTKRNWALVIPAIVPLLQPFADGLSRKMFGSKDIPNLSIYDNQIQQLKESQENLINQVNMHSTIYKIDSEKKAEEIGKLQLTQSRIELQLKIQNQTIEKETAEHKEKISSLQYLLDDCKKQIEKNKEDQEKANNEIMKLKESVTSIEDGLKFLNNQSDENKHRIDDIIIHSKVDKIITDIHTMLSRFKYQQKTLFDVLVNANRGLLDPYILTPLNLINMMLEAQPYLDEDYKFPYHPSFENARKLYKLVDPSFYLYNGSIIWILKMDLVKHKIYNLYKMTSFPVYIAPKTFAFIIPQQPFILVDQEENEHTLVSKNDFQISCKNIEDSQFLCNQIQTNYVHQFLDCEIRILLNMKIDPNQCQIRFMSLQEPVFLQLLEYKTWIYATSEPNDVAVICNKVPTIITIANTGFLKLGKCNPVGKHLFLQPYLDPKIQNIYGNYSTNTVNLRKYIEFNSVLRPFSEQRNIEPFNFDYLKRSSTGLSEISKENIGDEKRSNDVQKYVIIVATFVVVLTIAVGIILTRDTLLKLFNYYASNEFNLQTIKT